MTRRRSGLFLVAPAAFALLVAGCGPGHEAVDHTDYSDRDDDWIPDESSRTEAMESMADQMNADLRDAIDNAESEQDLERAYQEFEASRQELNELSESDELDDSDEYAPEP